MATGGTVKLNASKLFKQQVTVNVLISGIRLLGWRLTIGSWFIRFGCWVASVGHRMESEPD